MKSLSEQVRAAVRASDMARRRLAMLADIDPAALSRFVTHGVGLSVEAMDRLGVVLGLRVVAGKKKEK